MRTIQAAIALSLTVMAASPAIAESPSDRIDALIEARLGENNVAPNPGVDDTVFLRRIYLDIAGRIPTIEEADAFHTDDAPLATAPTTGVSMGRMMTEGGPDAGEPVVFTKLPVIELPEPAAGLDKNGQRAWERE